jgi:entry exclusion lipoprotein TrbK
MKTNTWLAVVLILTASVLFASCKDTLEVASPDCVDIEKITDPVERAERLKKCPRGGPTFKPSPVKSW